MTENVGSSDIWSDGVEKSENCRTQTLPLMLLLRRLPPRAKQQPPLRKRLLQRRPLLARQRSPLLPQLRSPLLLKRNSLFLLTLIPANKKSLTPYEWATFYIFFEDCLTSIQHYFFGELRFLLYSSFTFLPAIAVPTMAIPNSKRATIIIICY